jgi:multidrug efflux pump subunit AcrA (membrane-fusion protein)
MASKDQRPSQRLGKSNPRRVKIITWILGLGLCGGGVVAAYKYTGTTEVEVAVARVRTLMMKSPRRTRGDIKSARSLILKAPQVPGLRIVKLAPAGRPVKKGDVVVEFDGSQQDQNIINRTNSVRAADGNIVQTKATQRIDNEADSMNKMSSEYDLERSKLDASKAEVLSAIEG